MMPDKPQSGETESVLSNVSLHLDALADRIMVLEETVCKSLAVVGGELNNSRVTELQSLDFLRQSLQDLAVLIHLMDLHAPYDAADQLPLDKVTSKLKLAATKELLHKSSHLKNLSSLGDVDFF
jgi:hypothetical protein